MKGRKVVLDKKGSLAATRNESKRGGDKKGENKAGITLSYPTTDTSTRNDSKKLPAGMSLESLLFKPRNLTNEPSATLSKFQIAKNQEQEAQEYLKRLDDLEINDPVIREAVDLAMGVANPKIPKFHVSQVSYVYDLGFKSVQENDGEKFVYIGSLDTPTIKISKPMVKSEKQLKQEKMDLNERYLIQELVKEMSRASASDAAYQKQKAPPKPAPVVDDDSGSDIFETDGIEYVVEIKEKKGNADASDTKPANGLKLFKAEAKNEVEVELPFNFEGGQNLQNLIQNSHKIKINRNSNVEDGAMELETLEEIDDGDGVNYDYDNFYDSDSDEGLGSKKGKTASIGKPGETARLNQDFQKLDSHFSKKYGAGLREDKSDANKSSGGKEKRKSEGLGKKSTKRTK